MPCSHGNRTPREIYDECIKAKLECSPNDSIVRWFGRTAEEILKALEWHEVRMEMICPYCKCKGGSHYGECAVFKQEQKPMTREEALYKGQMGGMSVQATQSLITALEALGLLKFEEAPVPEEAEIVRLPVDDRTYEIGSDTYGVKVENIVKVLQKAGYRIYKGAYASEVKKQKPMHKFRDAKDMIYFVHDEYLGEQ